jgi:nitroreductase
MLTGGEWGVVGQRDNVGIGVNGGMRGGSEFSRRTMIRGLVGGTVALGSIAGGLAGCESAESAYQPWQGAVADPDMRLRLIAWASLAPSSHNLQPWRIHLIGSDRMVLFADPTRVHGATDPYMRQVTISQGTFLELMAMAALSMGARLDIAPFPDGVYNTVDEMVRRPVAVMRVVEDVSAVPPALFAVVKQRRTARMTFLQQAVSERSQRALQDAALDGQGVIYGALDRGSALERLRAAIIEAIRREMADPAALNELAEVTRLGSAEVLSHRDGIVPVRGWMGEAMHLLFGRDVFRSPDSFVVTETFRRMAEWLSSATSFSWITTPGNSRQDQLAAGRAYMRLDLAAASEGLAIQPHSQPLQEVAIQRQQRADVQALLAAGGGTVQMLARVGHVEKAMPPSPRRSARDFL